MSRCPFIRQQEPVVVSALKRLEQLACELCRILALYNTPCNQPNLEIVTAITDNIAEYADTLYYVGKGVETTEKGIQLLEDTNQLLAVLEQGAGTSTRNTNVQWVETQHV